mmetsp:Transcript_18670/g.26298  ORF Transcript_18670/g.26298 Transcript_18670/m.26298 type:complete len:305 (+) Transcript_18670:151-1065(+)
MTATKGVFFGKLITTLLILLCPVIKGCKSFTPSTSTNLKSSSHTETVGSSHLNMGGYQSTAGTDPSSPLQFFILPNKACPYAQRTHITLIELNIDFSLNEVTLTPTKPDWYLKINPRGKVPAIRIPKFDNQVVYESAICDEFLCDFSRTTLQNDHDLMPTDPMLRSKIRLCNDHCDNVFAKTQFTFLMNKDDDKDQELKNDMENALLYYEDLLTQNGGGPYLFGENFTIADVHIIPFIQRLVVTMRYFKNYELPSEKFPNFLNWIEACSERESVKNTILSEEDMINNYKRFFEMNYKFGGLNKN